MKIPGELVLGTFQTPTRWRYNGSHFWLASLCGMIVGMNGEDLGSVNTQGMSLVGIAGQRFEGKSLYLKAVEIDDHTVISRWQIGNRALFLTNVWRVCEETGIVSRRDTLVNKEDAPVIVTRCMARVALPPGRYECYTQESRWCHENQGAWQLLRTGVYLQHAWGRTTEGSTPYLALRLVGAERGLAFHVLPCGNWTIRVATVTQGGDLPYAVVELGLSDENLHYELQPGQELTLPELLFQPLPDGLPHLGAPDLHRYLYRNLFHQSKPHAPVVYNTWFDQFDILDVLRLRSQLKAAAEIGCDVFVIDAGWYGASGSSWYPQAGDWREKTETAFRGQMREFAEEVRAAGLGFGIWMEPERFGSQAPIRARHPEWFVTVGDNARIDLLQPAAYEHVRTEIARLIETYELAWLKIDFNFTLDADASGAELAGYMTAWYRLLDEVRAVYRDTFIEGCSSGAMRADLAMLSHFDGQFLSDTTNPVDMLRIRQGAWLRLPPGRLLNWAVLRSAGKALPHYGKSVVDSPDTVLVPGGALWEPSATIGAEEALLCAMPGGLGLSGDLAGLSATDREVLRQGIEFYKNWRSFLAKASGHLLTAPEPLSSREGWVGFQLVATGTDTSLVFVYCLGNAGAPPSLRLRELAPDREYTILRGFTSGETGVKGSGREFMTGGLPLHRLGHIGGLGIGAEVFIVEALK
jgi:alpha-galactosidase